MNELLDIFPFIQKIKIELEKQNKLLNKVTLTGKINALKEAGNLFEFTDKTIAIFDDLNVELIDALLHENLHKLTNELSFKAQTAIDILIRNLFERTADVGFLATDSVIIDFLTSDNISVETMQTRLKEYVQKYSVYNEIVIFDTESNAKVNINENNILSYSKDSIIEEALNSDDYVEVYKPTDIFKSQKNTLVYAQKIMKNNKPVGVLCLCFKLEDELSSIFASLETNKNDNIAISNKNGLIFSKHTDQKVKFSNDEYKIIKNKYIALTAKTIGYQDYFGISDWYASALTKIVDDNTTTKEENSNSQIKKSLLNEKLTTITEQANDLMDDIADVIINGELIAAKRKVYVLTPILDNLRNISVSLLEIITNSVDNLEFVVRDALIHDVEMASLLAIDIMDRNLYERANDCRWWALTPLFEEELSKNKPDIGELEKTLSYINNLYTVYTDIFLFNSLGEIIASSNSKKIVGHLLNDEYIKRTLSNKDSQNYYVSEFENSELYNNQATYIYSASIQTSNNLVSGMGVVFDSTVEFQAILVDSFPKNQKGFSAFINSDKTIVATTSDTLKILDKLEIDDKYLKMNSDGKLTEFIVFQEKNYLMSLSPSQGYREYKVNDNYTNIIYSVTFIEV
jgi:hypothetical protein